MQYSRALARLVWRYGGDQLRIYESAELNRFKGNHTMNTRRPVSLSAPELDRWGLVRLVLVLLAFFIPWALSAQVLVLHNGGFETIEESPGTAINLTTLGVWNGDPVQFLSSADSGITPYSGSGMVKFIYTYPPAGGATGASQLDQLIDVSSFATLLGSGATVTVTFEGYFNRVAGNANTDTAFGMLLEAYTGSPANFPSGAGFLTDADDALAYIFTDSNPATWEHATMSLALPANTTFLRVEIYAEENVFNDTSGTEFDGHFGDGFSLSYTAIPEPTTYAMLAGLGTLGLAVIRRCRTV